MKAERDGGGPAWDGMGPAPRRGVAEAAAHAATRARRRIERPLARWRGCVLVALVALAGVVRFAAWCDLADGPCVQLHRWPESDASCFHAWGEAIAAGDLLSTSVEPPHHHWHQQIAAAALRADPALATAVTAAANAAGRTPEHQLWIRWCGERNFYQEPLYAYLVGATYALAGPDPHVVLWLQLASGLLLVVVSHRLAQRWFGDVAAVVAGAAAALCAPLVEYELVLVRDAWVALLGPALVLLFVNAWERGGRVRVAAVGALGAAALLLKSTFAPLLVVFVVAIGRRHGRGAAMLLAACCLCGPLLVLARHVAVGATSWSPATGAVATFVGCNANDYDVAAGGLHVPAHAPAFLAASDGSAAAAVVRTIATHDGVGWLSLVLRKAIAAWHWYDVPDNSNLAYVQLHSPTLARLPCTSWLVLGTALAGVALAWRRRRRTWPLLLLVASQVVVLALFPVNGRLRSPLVAALLPFAGCCAATLLHLLAQRAWWRAVGVAALVAVVLLAGSSPLPADVRAIRPVDWFVPMRIHYEPEERRAAAAGDGVRLRRLREEETSLMRQFLRAVPDGPPPAWVPWCAEAHRILARALAAAGRVPEARVEEELSARLSVQGRRTGR